jgi:hypothetical protein
MPVDFLYAARRAPAPKLGPSTAFDLAWESRTAGPSPIEPRPTRPEH